MNQVNNVLLVHTVHKRADMSGFRLDPRAHDKSLCVCHVEDARGAVSNYKRRSWIFLRRK